MTDRLEVYLVQEVPTARRILTKHGPMKQVKNVLTWLFIHLLDFTVFILLAVLPSPCTLCCIPPLPHS